MEVVVEFEYDALHEDELTLRLGDIIKNVCYIEEEGWMEGELNGKRGVFPDNFVKVVKKETTNEVNKTSEPPKKEPSKVSNLVKRMSHIGIPLGGFQPPPPAVAKKQKKRQCKVVFEYQPLNKDELELKLGDIIDITEEVEDGWWSGTVNGKSGLFPSNFVEELEASGEEPELNNTPANVTDPSGLEVATTPTSPQPASGNDPVRHPPKGPRLGFGDIFKDGSGKLKPKVNNQTEENNQQVPSLPSAAKPTHPTMNDSHREEADSKPKAASVSSVKEYCKVTFAYEAKNEDELSLKEGEIVRILSKDTGEPGWWRGEVGGNNGVFPNNFVTVVSEPEKEAPTQRGSVKTSYKPDLEQKPVKPPPPSKQSVHKPEVPSADKKPHHAIRPTDKVDKTPPETKPNKPPPPMPPAKKPVPTPPKKPEKLLSHTQSFKQNGEVPSTRLKSDVEPVPSPVPKTPIVDAPEKPAEPADLKVFDELSLTSEKLPHPTANRPKFHGRRLPARVGEGHLEERSQGGDMQQQGRHDAGFSQPPTKTLSQSPPLHRACEAKPSSAAAPNLDADSSQSSKTRLEPKEPNSQLDEFRSQIKELLLTVELLKAQQMKEISELRGELDEERLKRVTLQMEVEELKRAIHLT
ncbi:CD2-associated protein [Austrofundulus limnaeus]|uniref:Osteoclast-stimulating factor 1 n=1 Tax=Austrofundulus limnaeus TaxID=52670 RepID=A0A2I4D6N8_AUSLI|nr:PREDICTED: CD2-associated protein [Austrofundulus limnaeus]